MTDRSRMNVIVDDGMVPARAGYDHAWFPWSPGPSRPQIQWPGDHRTAVSVVVRLGAVEWEDATTPRPKPDGGRGIGAPPDVPRMSHREFGHRVGVFRLMGIARDFGITPAVAIDVLTAEQYAPLVDYVKSNASEFLAGGISASRPISSDMTEAEERDYIAVTLDRLAGALGSRPEGWLGPELNESARTLLLLADAGLRYQADWANDEVPYRDLGAGDDFWAFPLSWELSDFAMAYLRDVEPDVWADSVIEAFDVLHAEGGRTIGLHLQPWVSGQAFRASAVERVLKHMREAEGVWFASPVQIVNHCRQLDESNPPWAHPGNRASDVL